MLTLSSFPKILNTALLVSVLSLGSAVVVSPALAQQEDDSLMAQAANSSIELNAETLDSISGKVWGIYEGDGENRHLTETWIFLDALPALEPDRGFITDRTIPHGALVITKCGYHNFALWQVESPEDIGVQEWDSGFDLTINSVSDDSLKVTRIFWDGSATSLVFESVALPAGRFCEEPPAQ